MTPYLSQPFGSASAEAYGANGINRLFAAPYSKVVSMSGSTDGTGTVNKVTDITLASGVTFQEIVYVEDTASADDDFKFAARKFITQTVTFSVDVQGAEGKEQVNQLVLPRSHVFIAQRRDGKLYVFGRDFGLKVTDFSDKSGAKFDDASAATFTCTGPNLGPAPELVMSEANFKAIVTEAI